MNSWAEFTDALIQLHLAAGEPSRRQIEALARARNLRCPRSTASDLLTGKSMPTVEGLRGFLAACRAHADRLGIDLGERADPMVWQTNLQQLRKSNRPGVTDLSVSAQARAQAADVSAATRLHDDHTSSQGNRRGVLMPSSRSRYLLIVNQDFGRLPPIPHSFRDAHKLTAAVEARSPWFEVQQVFDGSAAQVLSAVDDVLKLGAPVVVHLATHGAVNDIGELVLAFSDTEGIGSGVRARELVESLMHRSFPTLVILDASNAGLAFPGTRAGSEAPFAFWASSDAHSSTLAGVDILALLGDLLTEGARHLPELLALGDCVQGVDDLAITRFPTSSARTEFSGWGPELILGFNVSHPTWADPLGAKPTANGSNL